MFCVQCGTTIGAGQRFCPACGKPAGNAPTMSASAVSPQSRLSRNLRLLAFLWFALSAMRLLPGAVLLSIFGSIEGYLPQDVPAFVFPIVRMIAYVFIGAAAVGFVAGWGLLHRLPWARTLAMVLGLLSLINVPFGTTIGIYTLWVLVPAESEAEYGRISQPA